MLLPRLKQSRDSAPGAEHSRAVEPDHKSCARQADIEGRGSEVAVADPPLSSVRFFHQCSKNGDVIFPPMRLPDCVETNHRRSGALTEPAREGSFAAARATQD